MASIRDNLKDGNVVSYRFIACMERDAQGKQIRKYLTWTPPDGMTPSKAKKLAQKEADQGEEEIRQEYTRRRVSQKGLNF